MELLPGPEWFEQVWRKPDEKKSNAITRLAADAKLQIKTLYRVLRSDAVRAETAQALRKVEGGERLDLQSLLMPPKKASSESGEHDLEEQPNGSQGAA